MGEVTKVTDIKPSEIDLTRINGPRILEILKDSV